MAILDDMYKLSPGALVELFEVDATALGDTIYRFHSGKNELKNDVVWQTNTYVAYPIEASGFEITAGGTFPKPTMKVANITGSITALNKLLNDLVGVKVSRKRTLVKYLDAVNFTGGTNPDADPNQYLPDDVYYVNRKISENRIFAEYELVSAIDLENVKLPRRQYIQNTCLWGYRSSECTYAGSNYWDANDNPVASPASDVCGKKVSSCKLRFGENAVLPFGGFPGVGLF